MKALFLVLWLLGAQTLPSLSGNLNPATWIMTVNTETPSLTLIVKDGPGNRGDYVALYQKNIRIDWFYSSTGTKDWKLDGSGKPIGSKTGPGPLGAITFTNLTPGTTYEGRWYALTPDGKEVLLDRIFKDIPVAVARPVEIETPATVAVQRNGSGPDVTIRIDQDQKQGTVTAGAAADLKINGQTK